MMTYESMRWCACTVALSLLAAACGAPDPEHPPPRGAQAHADAADDHSTTTTRTRPDNARERLGDLAPLPETSLSGKDADADHIRDDIGEFIDAEYGQRELARLGARQLARGLQHGLVHADDEDAAIEALHETDHAITCLHGVVDVDTAGRIVDELEARTVDTEERFAAYRRLQKRASGMYLRGGNDPPGRCRFDRRGLAP